MKVFGILTFYLILRHRGICILGMHPYEFGHMSRNNISISRIMDSKMPTKQKISISYGFELPSIYKLLKKFHSLYFRYRKVNLYIHQGQ